MGITESEKLTPEKKTKTPQTVRQIEGQRARECVRNRLMPIERERRERESRNRGIKKKKKGGDDEKEIEKL